ncbi:MAG: hypothetical protein NTV62_01285 [Candidatus Gribaldobacteria bacterium]|nr:hypothetical protein [Candidatus Gribaldobacteria bacterium]
MSQILERLRRKFSTFKPEQVVVILETHELAKPRFYATHTILKGGKEIQRLERSLKIRAIDEVIVRVFKNLSKTEVYINGILQCSILIQLKTMSWWINYILSP